MALSPYSLQAYQGYSSCTNCSNLYTNSATSTGLKELTFFMGQQIVCAKAFGRILQYMRPLANGEVYNYAAPLAHQRFAMLINQVQRIPAGVLGVLLSIGCTHTFDRYITPVVTYAKDKFVPQSVSKLADEAMNKVARLGDLALKGVAHTMTEYIFMPIVSQAEKMFANTHGSENSYIRLVETDLNAINENTLSFINSDMNFMGTEVDIRNDDVAMTYKFDNPDQKQMKEFFMKLTSEWMLNNTLLVGTKEFWGRHIDARDEDGKKIFTYTFTTNLHNYMKKGV